MGELILLNWDDCVYIEKDNRQNLAEQPGKPGSKPGKPCLSLASTLRPYGDWP